MATSGIRRGKGKGTPPMGRIRVSGRGAGISIKKRPGGKGGGKP